MTGNSGRLDRVPRRQSPLRLMTCPRALPEKLKATGALGAPSGRFCLA